MEQLECNIYLYYLTLGYRSIKCWHGYMIQEQHDKTCQYDESSKKIHGYGGNSRIDFSYK